MYLTYFREHYINSITDTTLYASDVASVSVIGPSPNEQAITQVRHDSTHSKKRTASGDLPQQASKTQILLLKEPHKASNYFQ